MEIIKNPRDGREQNNWPLEFQGMSSHDIADMIGCSEQWVSQIIGNYAEPALVCRNRSDLPWRRAFSDLDGLAFGILKLRVPAIRGSNWVATREDFEHIRDELKTQDGDEEVLDPKLKSLKTVLEQVYLDKEDLTRKLTDAIGMDGAVVSSERTFKEAAFLYKRMYEKRLNDRLQAEQRLRARLDKAREAVRTSLQSFS